MASGLFLYLLPSLIGNSISCLKVWASTMVQEVKNLPAMQETQDTQVWSLGGEDPLEKEMATCSSVLVWKIPWTEEPCCLQFMGYKRVGHDWVHIQQIQILQRRKSVLREVE